MVTRVYYNSVTVTVWVTCFLRCSLLYLLGYKSISYKMHRFTLNRESNITRRLFIQSFVMFFFNGNSDMKIARLIGYFLNGCSQTAMRTLESCYDRS